MAMASGIMRQMPKSKSVDEHIMPLSKYSDNEEEGRTESIHDRTESRLTPNGSESGLVSPKRLVNPCLHSKEHRALRQELKINQKIGKTLPEKPELIRVLKDREQREKKKEMDEQLKTRRTSFEKRLEEQAKKIIKAEHEAEQLQQEDDDEKPEFFKMHSKIVKAKSND